MYTLYFDSDGNARFKDEYLPGMTDTQQLPSSEPPVPSATFLDPKKRSLRSLTKDTVCTKFDGYIANAQSWLKLFVIEYDCLGNS